MLADAGLHDLLEFKQIVATKPKSEHMQRKQYAFRKCLEYHLNIPNSPESNGKKYYIHRYHWPIALLEMELSSSMILLSSTDISSIHHHQEEEYGITNTSLNDRCNKYKILVGNRIADDTSLSLAEERDLQKHVQAPIATRADILKYISKFSERSQRRYDRGLASITSEVRTAPSPSNIDAEKEEDNVSEASLSDPNLQTEDNVAVAYTNIACDDLELTSQTEAAPTTVQTEAAPTTVIMSRAAPTHPVTVMTTASGSPLSLACNDMGATSPTSPIASRALVFGTPTGRSTISITDDVVTPGPMIIPTYDSIVTQLRDSFQQFLKSGQELTIFVNKPNVRLAWSALAQLYKTTTPIELWSTDGNNPKKYWLFVCQACCDRASIGTMNFGPRLCQPCQNRQLREHNQLSKNLEKLVHPSSRAPSSSLARHVLLLRQQNLRKQLNAEKRRSSRLQAYIERNTSAYIDESDENARSMIKAVAAEVASDTASTKKIISDIILKKGLPGGKKIPESDIEDFVDHVVDEISNFGKAVVEGQKTQVRFLPRMLRLAMSLWMRSKSGYDDLREQSVAIMPSASLLKKIQQGMRVNEGHCAKIYGWFHDSYVSKCDKVVHGHLMCDEMKLKSDIYWNCSNHAMVGLAASRDGVDKLLVEDELMALFSDVFASSSDANDTKDLPTKAKLNEHYNRQELLSYKPATYVNLWRLRTTTNVTQSCEFFFNTGSLSGDELLRQFMRVAGHYEMIGVQILGLLCDAAGQNARLFHLLRGGATVGLTGYPTFKDTTFSNHINPERAVGTFHCSTHNLKAIRNQLLRSHTGGARLFAMNGVHFGWAEIELCNQRDLKRQARRTKLSKASVEIDAYSTMCVSYAKAPSAWETLIEQCDYISDALHCEDDILDLPKKTAFDMYKHIVPFLRLQMTPHTPYHLQSALNTLEYTCVVGAIFNEFFLNSEVRVTLDNIEQSEKNMMELLGFFDKWYEEEPNEPTSARKSFISATTYKNMRTSIRGFFEYCRVAFQRTDPPKYVLISHSNSSSIESVFALVRNMRRDTPQGFVSSASVQNSTDAIRLMAKFSKASYESGDVPDEDSPSKSFVGRKDDQRLQKLREYMEVYNKRRASRSMGMPDFFETTDTTKLSSAYNKLLQEIKQKVLPLIAFDGFLGGVLLKDDDFVETMKSSFFTQNEEWYYNLWNLDAGEERSFNATCSLIMSLLFQRLFEASQTSKKAALNSSYHYLVYKMMQDRNGESWKSLQNLLPVCLWLQSPPICLLIMHLSDVLLTWVRDAMLQQAALKLSEVKKVELQQQKAKYGDYVAAQDNLREHAELIQNVQRFVGWAVFSLRRKLENQMSDNEEKIDILDSMTVYHHEVVDDEEYMSLYYAKVDQLTNKGGLSLVAKPFFPFAKSLMKQVVGFTYDQSFQQQGTEAIASAVQQLLENAQLKDLFWRALGQPSGYLMNDTTQTSRLLVFNAICKKTMNAWAGQISDRYKEICTGRHVKTVANVALRVGLDIQTQQSRTKPCKRKRDRKESNEGTSEVNTNDESAPVVNAETGTEQPKKKRRNGRQKLNSSENACSN
jgi:hypothetical protein